MLETGAHLFFFFPFFLVFIEPTWRQCLWGDWCCVQAQSKHTDDEPYKMAGLWSAFEVSKWNMRCLTVWLTLGSNPRGAFAFWPGCPACSWSWMMLKHIGFYCSEKKKGKCFRCWCMENSASLCMLGNWIEIVMSETNASDRRWLTLDDRWTPQTEKLIM